MKKGLLIILSGPSGVGKGTVRRQLEKNKKVHFEYSVSSTTRLPRNKEVDGVDYNFISKEEFLKNIKENNFLEYSEFVGNYYGTSRIFVEELRNQGKNVFLEIEINGATQVMNKVKDDGVVSIFLMPPSFELLEERIRKRKTESEELIQQRLAKGRKEMSMANNYQYVVLNDTVTRAADEIAKIIIERSK